MTKDPRDRLREIVKELDAIAYDASLQERFGRIPLRQIGHVSSTIETAMRLMDRADKERAQAMRDLNTRSNM